LPVAVRDGRQCGRPTGVSCDAGFNALAIADRICKAWTAALNIDHRKSFQTAAALGLSLWLPLAIRAEDWPQWRGPSRDGVWHETVESFPPGDLKVSWRAPVGPGFSSPVVAQGRVYVTDSQVSRPKAHERVLCFDAKTGKCLWTHSYEADYADWAFDPKNPFGPRPTPIVSGSRLFTLGARGRLICFKARNGKVVWEKNFGNKSKDSAFTPSPLIEGNLLIRGGLQGDQPRGFVATDLTLRAKENGVDSPSLRRRSRVCAQRRGTGLRLA